VDRDLIGCYLLSDERLFPVIILVFLGDLLLLMLIGELGILFNASNEFNYLFSSIFVEILLFIFLTQLFLSFCIIIFILDTEFLFEFDFVFLSDLILPELQILLKPELLFVEFPLIFPN